MLACVFSLMIYSLVLIAADEGIVKVSAQTKKPTLLYISRSDCTFCHRFEEDVLKPLIKSGTYKNKIIIRKIVIDDPEPVANFKGNIVAPINLAQSYSVDVTPTLLFVDAEGNELVTRIVGYQKSDYYSHFLEQAITKAYKVLGDE